MKKVFFAILVGGLMLSACEDSEVKVPPVIEELVVESDSIQIEAYMSFSFTYRFTDNTGLSKFKVRIEDEFEGARLSAAPWNLEEEYDLEGLLGEGAKSYGILYDTEHPDVEPGRYRLDVIVQDIDLNETSESQYFVIYE